MCASLHARSVSILKTWRDFTRGAAALALLVGQISAFAGLPIADALLETRSVAESEHIEQTEADCSTHHDDRFCQIIRSLSGQYGASGAVPQLLLRPLEASVPVLRESDFRRSFEFFVPVGLRAPPFS